MRHRGHTPTATLEWLLLFPIGATRVGHFGTRVLAASLVERRRRRRPLRDRNRGEGIAGRLAIPIMKTSPNQSRDVRPREDERAIVRAVAAGRPRLGDVAESGGLHAIGRGCQVRATSGLCDSLIWSWELPQPGSGSIANAVVM